MKTPLYKKIDLYTGKAEDFPISKEYYEKYFGGKCLGARLLLDFMKVGLDPLDPDAVLIINTGPLNGTNAPSSSRFNMSFKNVMTGGIASSNCGGNFGVMLKKAGYDGLIITGKADAPSMIEIIDGEVSITDAKDLWGLDVEEAQEKLPDHYGRLVIGQSGENLVRFAGAVSGERIAGRCGAGAVMGSKNIKAVTAYGTQSIHVENPKKYYEFIKKWVHFIKSHPMTGDALPHYGSAGLVNKANATHALPSYNFKEGHYKEADAVSGETLAETELSRNNGCVSCPIRCERRVKVNDKEVKGPEYETLGFFGPNIGAKDLKKVLELNYETDILGMDTISLASTIAFAMELKKEGLADFGIEFGDTSNLSEVIKKIATREGIYSEMANGSKWLSEKYGGKEFAMHSKGLEMASYEPRRSVGMGLGYATSNRGGCHLNGGYLALLESVGVLSLDPLATSAKAELTVFLQDALESVSSAGCCLFSAQTFVPAIFFKLGPEHIITRITGKVFGWFGLPVKLMIRYCNLLAFNSLFILPHAKALNIATGLKMNTGRFVKLGERSFNLERLFSLREGLTAADDSLPDRLTKVPQDKNNPKTVVPLEKMMKTYYATRGWSQKGVPTSKTLKRLDVEYNG